MEYVGGAACLNISTFYSRSKERTKYLKSIHSRFIDTCQPYANYDYVYDKTGNCRSKNKETYNVCAGSCGNSQTNIFLDMDNSFSSVETDCKCCQPIPSGKRTIAIVCEDTGIESTADILEVESCQCQACGAGNAYTIIVINKK